MPKSLKNLVSVLLLMGILLPVFSAMLVLPQGAYAQVTVTNKGQASLEDEFAKVGCSSKLLTLLKLNFDCVILNVIWTFDNFLLGTLLDWAANLFNLSVEKNLGNISGSILVTTGWGIIRDITNLFFILILLWIALATILNIPRYGAKDLLATLIISALLINFSLAIGGFFINFSNALAKSFNDAVRARGSVTLQLLDFTNIQKFSTTRLTPQSPEAICNNEALQTYPLPDTGIEPEGTTNERNEAENNCMQRPEIKKLGEEWRKTDAAIKNAIYIALWLIIVIPVLIFVFLAGAVFFLIRYLQLSLLLVFAPIVFLLRVLPDTQHLWSDWWNRLMKQSFFAPAYLFLLFLTITTFNVWSGRTIVGGTTAAAPSSQVYAAKEPPLLKSASIGGLGTGLRTQEAFAETPPPATKQTSKGFFALGFEMVLFVALMIMNLMVAQQMGIKFAGTVTGWGNRAARWSGRKARGAAYRQAIRAAAPPATGLTESALGRAMARIPGVRAALQPAVAIQKQKDAIDAERAKRVAELATVSPVTAAAQLQGESMGVKAAYAKSANPEAMRKLLGGMVTKNPDGSNNYDAQEEYVRQVNENADRYRIEDFDKKVGEAMAKDPRGLTLRTIAKTGASTSDPNFQEKVDSYLAGLDDIEYARTMTAKTIEEDPYAQDHIIQNFKDERRIGNAVLGTPEKLAAFNKFISKTAERMDHGLVLPDLPPKERREKMFEYASTAMRNAGNDNGADALISSPIVEVLAGAGVRKFTREDYRPPIGACCLPDGNCVHTTNADCTSQGGSFKGIGIPCTPGLCAPTAQPTPGPTGGTTPPTTPGGPSPQGGPPPPGGTTGGTVGPAPTTTLFDAYDRPIPPTPPTPPTPPPASPPPTSPPTTPAPHPSPTPSPAPPAPTTTPTAPTPPAGTIIPPTGIVAPPTPPQAGTPRQKVGGTPPKASPNDLAAFSRSLAAALNERVANQLTPLVENMDRVNAAVATLSQEISQGTLNSEKARGAIKNLTQEIKDMRPRGAVQNDSREALTKVMARIRRIEETSRTIAESAAASGNDADKETVSLLNGLHDASQSTRLNLAKKRELLP